MMTPLEVGTCRGCEREILWARTVHGRPIPLDPKRERRMVVTPDGVLQADTYVPHHATCPNVEQFRRRRTAT